MFTTSRIRSANRPAAFAATMATAFILLFVTFTVAAQPSSSNGAIVSLQGPSEQIHVGDEITVTVRISDVVDLFGVQMELAFDPLMLQVVDADAGTEGIQITPGPCPVPDWVALNSSDNLSGTINYAATELFPTEPITGTCDMAHIRFSTLQTSTTMVSFTDLLMSTPNGQPIPHTTEDLLLNIFPPPPVADFIGNPTSGIAPMLVNFSNLSAGIFTHCMWNFGDGNTSTTCIGPSNNYTAGGSYTVSLSVMGPGSQSTETKTGYITIYDPVSAGFAGSPTSGIAPLPVDFTNNSTGDFDTCSWTFGDGGSSGSYSEPSHNYTASGVFSVSLMVTGPGGTDTVTSSNYITVYEPSVAGFSGSPTSGMAPLEVDFVNSSSGDYDTCSWDFGDGGGSSDCSDPSQTYTAGGVYTVSLTIDGDGGMATETKTDYITVEEDYFSYIPIILKSS